MGLSNGSYVVAYQFKNDAIVDPLSAHTVVDGLNRVVQSGSHNFDVVPSGVDVAERAGTGTFVTVQGGSLNPGEDQDLESEGFDIGTGQSPGDLTSIDSDPGLDTYDPSIASFANGSYVVTYTQTTFGGGGSDTDVYFRIVGRTTAWAPRSS